MKCPGCGEEHSPSMEEADPQDPRFEPWVDLLEASGEHTGGEHLLVVKLKGETGRTELLITGLDDPWDQVELMGEMITTILVDSGDVRGAHIVKNVIANWLIALDRARQAVRASEN